MTCEICGKVPAAHIELRSASSRIIWWVRGKIERELCGMCAEVAYLSQQSKNFKQGWWGPMSALATAWFGFNNVTNIKNHRKKVDTVTIESEVRSRPHFSIRNDNSTVIAFAAGILFWFALGFWFFSQPSTLNDSNPESYLGTCWSSTDNDFLKLTDCSSPAASYQIYDIVEAPSQCPGTYLEAGFQIGCLRSFENN